MLPQRLVSEFTYAGERASVKETPRLCINRPTLTGEEDGCHAGLPSNEVRVCVRRLQGTRTLLKKTFKVAPQCLLYTLFERACDRLRIRESSVVFVHDGVVLSGRRDAATLGFKTGSPAVQTFAVCKTAWACKQRGAARKGLVSHEKFRAIHAVLQ